MTERQRAQPQTTMARSSNPVSSHHPPEVLLSQFSLYVHKGGLKPHLFYFYYDGSFLCPPNMRRSANAGLRLALPL